MILTQASYKKKSDVHLVRKLWHVTGVILILVIYHNVSRPFAIQLMTLASFIFIVNDLLRQNIPALNRLWLFVFRPIMRESEVNSMAGTSYLMLGSFIIILFFPKPIVVLSFLFLAIADPLASYVGIKFGKDKIFANKSLQGSAAAFFACSSISFIYFSSHNLMSERIFVVSLLSGLIGTAAEALPFAKLDDNFTIPVVSACLLWALFYVFGGF